MKIDRIFLIIIGLLSAIAEMGCSSSGKLAIQDLSPLYNPDFRLKELNYTIFNLDDSLTRLYFRFPLEKLKYVQKAGQKPYAGFRINYQVFDGYEKGMMVDSGSWQGADSLLFSGFREDSVSMKVKTGKHYILQVVFTDLNRKVSLAQLINLPKVFHGQSSDFLITDEFNRPTMRNYISKAEKVRIRARFSVDSSLVLKHYAFQQKSTPAAPYAYMEAEEIVTSEPPVLLEIKFKNNSTSPFILVDEGVYVTDFPVEDGFGIFRFYDGFPEIGSAMIMRESLRYISTDEEHYNLRQFPPKAAVDKFWTDLTGNSDRALNQIKRYYTRVEDANRLYSLSCEGWKSDRGMIYIVFGPPGVVYRNSVVEEWTYGEPGNPLSVKFYFHPVKNKTGGFDYYLVRTPEYKGPWHLAVSNWRR